MYSSKGTDADRLKTLVEQHADLVKRIAHHLLGRLPASVQVDDLIQSGMIGLIEAAKKYDGSKGASFATYAGIRIRGAMLDEIRRGDWVPRSVHRNARKIAAAIKQVEDQTGRDAQDEEVAKALNLTLEEYHQHLQESLSGRLFSFEELNALEIPDSLDQNQAFEGVAQAEFQAHLSRALAELPQREQWVLALYYDEELNLKEIGQVLGVSESRVSQIHSQAALRLRSRLSGWLDNSK